MHHVVERLPGGVHQSVQNIGQLSVVDEIIEVYAGGVGRLHVVARLEILHFEDGRRQGIFAVVAVAEGRTAVDQPHQLGGGQVGGEALEALGDITIISIDRIEPKPSDRAASIWPRSTDWMPERMISQM